MLWLNTSEGCAWKVSSATSSRPRKSGVSTSTLMPVTTWRRVAKWAALLSRRSSRSTDGHHHVAQAHGLGGGRQVGGLFGVRGQGAAVGHVAEGAAAGAQGAQDHEGRRAVGEALDRKS